MPGDTSCRFDVFLSHNSVDKQRVEVLAHRLKEAGLRPWLDLWNLVPGHAWQEDLERALDASDSCAVFIGTSGVSPWQNEEMRAAISRRVSSTKSIFPVIPVLLPGAKRDDRSRLPAFLLAATWVVFDDIVEDEEALRRLICGIRNIEPGPSPTPEAFEGESPYRGLLFFDVEHAPLFFGRGALVDWLLHRLLPAAQSEDQNRFFGIIGPSGSGKSSLARAGLVAALKRGAIGASAHWPIAVLRPGADPLNSLAIGLKEAIGGTPTPAEVRELVREVTQSDRGLHLYVHLALRSAPPDRRFVLLIDQFEEIFTLCKDVAVREAIINNLMAACTVSRGQTIVIITLRADFYGECSAYPLLAAALSELQMLVGAMEPAQLRQAIERPAQRVGCELERGLADRLMEDVKDEAGGLPLLEYTLAELWNARRGRYLTHDAYDAIGGVAGALEGRANQVYESFSERERETCRRIFTRLVQPSERGHPTKRQARLVELLPAEGDNSEVMNVIGKLARPEARLITIETSVPSLVQAAGRSTTSAGAPRVHSQPAETQFVDVSHEALIRTWGRLQRWLDEDQEFLLWKKGLAVEIEMWEATSRDPDSLVRGLLLEQAKHWHDARAADLNRQELDFLKASVEADRIEREAKIERARQLQAEHEQRLRAESEAERQAARRARAAAGGLAATLILMLGGFAVYFILSKHNRAKDLADQARQKHSVELAVEAIRQSRVRQSVEALYATAAQDVPALTSHSGVNGVAWNAGRTFIATAHENGDVLLWKSAHESPQAWNAFNQDGKYPHPAGVLSVAFHPRDDNFVTGAAAPDSRVRIWRVGAVQPEWQSDPRRDDVNAVEFTRSGVMIAAITRSGELTVWNRETNHAWSINPPHQATTLATSPVEDGVAAGFSDGAIVWCKVGVESYQSVPGDERRGTVHDLAFSPDGKGLAIASQHGVWVWQTGSANAPRSATTTRSDAVTVAVAFSPQGDRIAAADADGFVSIVAWPELVEQSRLAVSDIGRITAIAFQPDPRRTGSAKLAVAGYEGLVRIFELNVDLLLRSLERQ